jgi:uncharacterized membrane protein YkoI
MRALGILLVFLASCAGEQEETIAIDAVPSAVMSAVLKRFPNATATEAAREREDGKLLYEVSVLDGSRKIDVTVTANGEITTIEGALTQSDLPAAVTQAVAARYPGAVYRIIEDVMTNEGGASKFAYYEVLIETADKRFLEVQIAPDGKILKEEKKAGVES